MAILKIDKFTDPHFLKTINRPLLTAFIEKFHAELVRRDRILPLLSALDAEFYNVVAHLVQGTEALPRAMAEALHVIQEMATPEGQQRIEQLASTQRGLSLESDPDCTCAELAMRVWLEKPELLARARNLHQVVRLCTFHHFSCKSRPKTALEVPGPETLKAMEAACDLWFSKHNRGRHNTLIEFYDLPGGPLGNGGREWWFLISHGDALTRTAKVERGLTEMLQYRPARQDVAVLNLLRHELRINARTIGERNLYRAVFGQAFHGDPNSFSERTTYTLDPLRTEGLDALNTRLVPGISRAVLRGVQLDMPGPNGLRKIYKAADIFSSLPKAGEGCIPQQGNLAQAWFDLHFHGSPTPRPIQLRPPNTLRLSRYADANLVENWLTRLGFRITRPDQLANDADVDAAQFPA